MRVQPNRSEDAELLTPGAVAALLSVDPKTVTRWAKAGKIDSIRTPGGHRRYRRADIEALRAGQPPHPESVVPDRTPSPAIPAQGGGTSAERRVVAPPPAAETRSPPWAAAELAESVAATLELDAAVAVEVLRRAQVELEEAEGNAYEATSRALEARARAEAEHERAAASERDLPRIPLQGQSGPARARHD